VSVSEPNHWSGQESFTVKSLNPNPFVISPPKEPMADEGRVTQLDGVSSCA
jgi:hypothetical protein